MREKSFEYLATGELGKKRKSMFYNELHRREPLGRSRGRGYSSSFPGESRYYGMTYPKNENGVAKAMIWPINQKNPLNLKESRASVQIDYKEKSKKYDVSMGYLLAGKYQSDWLLQHKLKQLNLEEIENARRTPIDVYRDNKTSVMRNETRSERQRKEAEDAAKPLWKMPRFVKTAEPKINTNHPKNKAISASTLKTDQNQISAHRADNENQIVLAEG